MLSGRAIGRLVANPKIRDIKKNDNIYKVCEFKLACQQRGDEVDFVKITAWRGMGDFIFKHVQKGQKVFVEGKLKIPPYDKDRGRAYEPYIVCLSFEFCDSKAKKTIEQPPHEEPSPGDDALYETLSEDDLLSDS